MVVALMLSAHVRPVSYQILLLTRISVGAHRLQKQLLGRDRAQGHKASSGPVSGQRRTVSKWRHTYSEQTIFCTRSATHRAEPALWAITGRVSALERMSSGRAEASRRLNIRLLFWNEKTKAQRVKFIPIIPTSSIQTIVFGNNGC